MRRGEALSALHGFMPTIRRDCGLRLLRAAVCCTALWSAVAAASTITAIDEKIHECESTQNADVCATAGSMVGASSDWGGPEGLARRGARAEELFERGCSLGSKWSCHAYAGRLVQRGAYDQGMPIAIRNCEQGYAFSCETAGWAFEKKGMPGEARKYYWKCCEMDKQTQRACRDLGRLSVDEAARKELELACGQGKRWACVATGYAAKSQAHGEEAKAIFMRECKASSEYTIACDEAIALIATPPDAKDFEAGQQLCAHWRGEEPYDAERAAQIESGAEESCRDRRPELDALQKKYSADPDVLFKLEQLWRISDCGRCD